jgi:hypothetical protein
MNVIATQTVIPANFGEGGANLAPNDGAGKPTLAAVLTEHQVALAALDGAGAMQKRTVTIDFTADLAAVAALTFDKNLGAVLPANARLHGATAETVTDFDDGTHSTFVATIGTSAGGNQVGTSLNVAAGQAGFPKAFAAGAQGYLMAPQGGAQLSVRITGGVNLNTCTAGHIVVNVFFCVIA